MKSLKIRARDLYRAPARWFLVCEPSEERTEKQSADDWFARGVTTDKIDKETATKLDLYLLYTPGEIVDILEGYTNKSGVVSHKIAGWNREFNPSNKIFEWNQGTGRRLYNYITDNFNNEFDIVDYNHDYCNQRWLFDNHNFAMDLHETSNFYDKLCSNEKLSVDSSAKSESFFNKFEGHVTQIYKTYKLIEKRGWSSDWTIPVLELSTGEYVILDKCTLFGIAAFVDAEVNIDVVLKI